MVVRDLALGLHAAGHRPAVYSPQLGKIAAEISRSGIPVVADLKNLSEIPDIIHGHHTLETVMALRRFPSVRGIFVCHDRLAWHDIPPLSARIHRYVAVDLNCRERFTLAGIADDRISVITNAVDTERFRLRPPLPAHPRKAVVFSNYAGTGTHLEPVTLACSRLGIELETIGSGSGTVSLQPEKVLGNYDLVFAKARCALEAMAVGTAVVLCDTSGLGPLVTSANVGQLRPWNFGMRLLTSPLDPELIMAEIRKYDARDSMAVSRYIRGNASLATGVEHYLSLYREVLSEPPIPLNGLDAGMVDDWMLEAAARIAGLESKLARLERDTGRVFAVVDWLDRCGLRSVGFGQS